MLSTENTWAWVMFSISACVIQGELPRLCHYVDPVPGVFQLLSNVSLSCTLREDCLKSLDANASHIFWKMNDTQISQEQYYFNATVSRVTFQAVKGYLTCHINMKGAANILHRFAIEVGFPPDKPKHISCVSYWRENITCFWDQGRETNLKTNFTLIRKWGPSQNDSCNTLENTCFFKFPRLHISTNLTIIVMAENALGKAQSDPFVLDSWHTWKTDPPQNVIVHSILGQSRSLFVTWNKPTEKPPALVLFYGLQYQTTGSSNWTRVTEEKINTTSFVIKNLKPFTNYIVAVRCIGESQFYWSDWSSKETGLTPEAKPCKGPELWRRITSLDSQGKRNVHLLWKALNRSEANGIILGYRVWYAKKRDPTVMLQCNTTYLNYSLFLANEAYIITLVAYNSAGDSPKATLIVPAINQTALSAVQYVKVIPQDDQLFVQWKTSRPPENGYVIEWCLILDTSPFAGPLHWVHKGNTSEMAWLKENVEQYKRYNISVYSVYDDGPDNPFSVPAYLQQDVPAEGPDILAPDLKDTETTIKWREIPVEKRRGFITNYTIFYKSAKGENAVTVNSTVHNYTLKSLQKNTDYVLYVMASTVKGGINSSIHFRTDSLGQDDTVVIVVPVLVCFLLIVNVLMICSSNKHRIKKHIWPEVADPAGSTLADWFHEHQYENDQTPKLLNPWNDFNTDFSTVEVLCLSDECLLRSSRKDEASLLHSETEVECSFTMSPPPDSTSNGEKTSLLQSMNTVMCAVLEEGYKSQIPDISRSLSKQPLLSNTSEKSTSDFETEINTADGAEENWCPQTTDENGVFQQINKTSADLKNSLSSTDSQIAPCLDSSNDPVFDNCCKVDKNVQEDTGTVDPNLQSPQQDNQPTNPVQTYITVELLELMLNNEM
ncbi:interleukin-6 receptor subunit beta-like [Scyliorhinus torazame]|uniref:interleukin-6 receptor subunit beta-like n=1 Tax=Scyliorhinus torazame TaxID=75743 RepID=UPI003B58EF7E